MKLVRVLIAASLLLTGSTPAMKNVDKSYEMTCVYVSDNPFIQRCINKEVICYIHRENIQCTIGGDE